MPLKAIKRTQGQDMGAFKNALTSTLKGRSPLKNLDFKSAEALNVPCKGVAFRTNSLKISLGWPESPAIDHSRTLIFQLVWRYSKIRAKAFARALAGNLEN